MNLFITPSSFWPIFHCIIKWIIAHISTSETLICRFWNCFGHFIAAPQISKSFCKQFYFVLFSLFVWSLLLYGCLYLLCQQNIIRQKQNKVLWFLWCVLMHIQIKIKLKKKKNVQKHHFNQNGLQVECLWGDFGNYQILELNLLSREFQTCIIEIGEMETINATHFRMVASFFSIFFVWISIPLFFWQTNQAIWFSLFGNRNSSIKQNEHFLPPREAYNAV